MSWTVNDIYELYLKLARKNQAGGISATELFYFWNTEQNMYYQDIVGRWQARSNGKQGINTGLILNETDLSELAPFTIPVTLSVSSGNATKPDDFIFRLAARINGSKVTFITPGQKTYVTSSVIDPPSVTDNCYYGIQYEDYYSFLPNTVTSVDLDYIASCNDVKWGFTFDADGRQVYNPGTSVQPKWSTPTIITITKRALTSLGISFKDQDFLSAGRTAQGTGN